MPEEQLEQTENQRIVTGKICDTCNVMYGPEITVCPNCGSTNLTDVITTPMLEKIHSEQEIKKHNRSMFITVLILFLIMFGLIAYFFIRISIEK